MVYIFLKITGFFNYLTKANGEYEFLKTLSSKRAESL